MVDFACSFTHHALVAPKSDEGGSRTTHHALREWVTTVTNPALVTARKMRKLLGILICHRCHRCHRLNTPPGGETQLNPSDNPGDLVASPCRSCRFVLKTTPIHAYPRLSTASRGKRFIGSLPSAASAVRKSQPMRNYANLVEPFRTLIYCLRHTALSPTVSNRHQKSPTVTTPSRAALTCLAGSSRHSEATAEVRRRRVRTYRKLPGKCSLSARSSADFACG